MHDIIPIGERVLLTPLKDEFDEWDGIIVPEKVDERTFFCEVVNLGTGVTSDLKVGNKVFISKYSGTHFKFKNEPYIIIMEDHIIGTLT